MAEFQIGGKPLFTQTGTDNPVMDSGVNVDSTLVGATFPAGHVLQYKFNTCGLVDGDNISTTSDSKQFVCSIDITKIHSNSKMIIRTFGTAYKNNNSAGGLRIYMLRTSPTEVNLQYNLWTNTSGFAHANSEGDGYMWGAYTGSTDNQINMLHGMYIDETDISSQITYTMYYSSDISGQSAYLYPNVGFDVTEIKA